MLVFYIIVTILQLHLNIRCWPMPITGAVQMPKPHIMEKCNQDTIDGYEKRGNPGIEMPCRPEGTGLFRNPVDVLGPLFPPRRSINICEVHITLVADTTSRIRFTKRGEKVCSEVCVQYRAKMIIEGFVVITLSHTFCDQSQDDNEMNTNQIELATKCTCVYKTNCNSKTTIIVYAFQANCIGFIRVTGNRAECSKPVT